MGYPVVLVGPLRAGSGSRRRSEMGSPVITVNFSYYGFFPDNAIKSRIFPFMSPLVSNKSGIESVLKMIAFSGCGITLVGLICVNVNKCDNRFSISGHLKINETALAAAIVCPTRNRGQGGQQVIAGGRL